MLMKDASLVSASELGQATLESFLTATARAKADPPYLNALHRPRRIAARRSTPRLPPRAPGLRPSGRTRSRGRPGGRAGFRSRHAARKRLRRLFQELCRLFALDTGKVLEEHVERVSDLQVVEKGPHGHTSTDEDGCTAEHLRLGVEHGLVRHGRPRLLVKADATPKLTCRETVGQAAERIKSQGCGTGARLSSGRKHA